MSQGISLGDYAQFSHGAGGFDEGLFNQLPQTAQAVSELNKALEAGSITGGASVDTATAGSGAPLKVESLERTLKLLTFRDTDIRLWRLFPKSAAFNTVEEFNQLESYGVERGGSYLEGELPEEEDSTYVRRAEQVKFYGVTKSVTHQMQLVRTHIGSAVQREITNGTMWVLRKVNRSLAFGDANIIPTEFNGVYKLHQEGISSTLSTYYGNETVVDLKGAALTQEDVEDAGRVILENFGTATHLFGPPVVLSDFGKDYYTKQRIFLGGNQQGYNQGINISYPKHVTMSFGDVDLEHDIFLQESKGRLTSEGATSVKAPASPNATSATATADAAESKFAASDAADYHYAVAAINRFGESALTVINTDVTVAATQSVDLVFTDGGGANAATGYVIYRSEKDPSGGSGATKFYPIFKVSKSELSAGYDGGAAATVRDRNRHIANTQQAYIADVPNTFEIKQLAPLMKMDLAVLSPAYRFMVLLYATCFLFAPKKVVRFVNIGRFTSS